MLCEILQELRKYLDNVFSTPDNPSIATDQQGGNMCHNEIEQEAGSLWPLVWIVAAIWVAIYFGAAMILGAV